nr:hypothetical protein [Staphylococcus epidermidis]
MKRQRGHEARQMGQPLEFRAGAAGMRQKPGHAKRYVMTCR